MKIYVLKHMHLSRKASQCQKPFCGKSVVKVKWLSLTRDKGHVIPKHSPHDIPVGVYALKSNLLACYK